MDKRRFLTPNLKNPNGGNLKMPMPPPPLNDRYSGGGGPVKYEYLLTKEKGVFDSEPSVSAVYKEDQKKKLIEDVWAWLHEKKDAKITIEKKRRG